VPAAFNYSVGTGTITDAKTVIALGAPTATGLTSNEIFTDGRYSASAVPDTCYLEKLECELDTPTNSPVNVVWNLAKDLAGDYAITPEITTALLWGKTGTATIAAFNETIECKRIRTYLAVAGVVYLVSRMSVATSTARLKALLFWRY